MGALGRATSSHIHREITIEIGTHPRSSVITRKSIRSIDVARRRAAAAAGIWSDVAANKYLASLLHFLRRVGGFRSATSERFPSRHRALRRHRDTGQRWSLGTRTVHAHVRSACTFDRSKAPRSPPPLGRRRLSVPPRGQRWLECTGSSARLGRCAPTEDDRPAGSPSREEGTGGAPLRASWLYLDSRRAASCFLFYIRAGRADLPA